ncbi:MAG: acyltransferase family protein [Lachnospiraceae bacterium]|nr:acyltransferase family protein [Lachnospiraceae bacterium]
MNSSKKHLDYLDLAKGIGIILVVLGHIEYISKDLRIFIVSFHMPLFFVVSGILLSISGAHERDFKDILGRRVRRILLPYLYFSILDVIIYIGYFMLTKRDGGWSTVFMDILQTFTLYGISVLWFLPALFFSEILFIALMKKIKIAATTVLSVVFAGLSIGLNPILEAANAQYGASIPFAIFHLFAVAVLRILFCMLLLNIGFLLNRLLNYRSFLSLDFVTGICLICVTCYASSYNGITDLHFLVFGNILLYLSAAVCGSLGVILLCRCLENISQNGSLRGLSWLGKNSLIVMVTHLDFYVLYVAEIGGLHFSKPIIAQPSHDAVLSLLSLFFVMIAEVVIINIVNRFFPFLMGIKKEHS